MAINNNLVLAYSICTGVAGSADALTELANIDLNAAINSYLGNQSAINGVSATVKSIAKNAGIKITSADVDTIAEYINSGLGTWSDVVNAGISSISASAIKNEKVLIDHQLTVSKLYSGVFNRLPAPGDFKFWTDQMDVGVTAETIARALLSTDEAQTLYSELTATQAYAQLFKNLTGWSISPQFKILDLAVKLVEEVAGGFYYSNLINATAQDHIDIITFCEEHPENPISKALRHENYSALASKLAVEYFSNSLRGSAAEMAVADNICDGGQLISVYIDPALSHQTQILSGLNFWDSKINADFLLVSSPEAADLTIQYEDIAAGNSIAHAHPPGYAENIIFTRIDIDIKNSAFHWDDPLVLDSMRVAVVAHELGHILGFNSHDPKINQDAGYIAGYNADTHHHAIDPRSIMYIGNGTDTRVDSFSYTEEDIRIIQLIQGVEQPGSEWMFS